MAGKTTGPGEMPWSRCTGPVVYPRPCYSVRHFPVLRFQPPRVDRQEGRAVKESTVSAAETDGRSFKMHCRAAACTARRGAVSDAAGRVTIGQQVRRACVSVTRQSSRQRLILSSGRRDRRQQRAVLD